MQRGHIKELHGNLKLFIKLLKTSGACGTLRVVCLSYVSFMLVDMTCTSLARNDFLSAASGQYQAYVGKDEISYLRYPVRLWCQLGSLAGERIVRHGPCQHAEVTGR